MTNHPNRGWRKAAEEAADKWAETTEAKVLAEVPLAAERHLEGMVYRLRQAYLAGYRAAKQRRVE